MCTRMFPKSLFARKGFQRQPAAARIQSAKAALLTSKPARQITGMRAAARSLQKANVTWGAAAKREVNLTLIEFLAFCAPKRKTGFLQKQKTRARHALRYAAVLQLSAGMMSVKFRKKILFHAPRTA